MGKSKAQNMDSFYNALYAIPVQYLENIAEKLQKINPDIAKLVDLRYEHTDHTLTVYMFGEVADSKLAYRNYIDDIRLGQSFSVLGLDHVQWASLAVLAHLEKFGFAGLRPVLARCFGRKHPLMARFEEQIASRQAAIRPLPLPITDEIRQEF
jgi:hypothetical protein